MILVDTDVLIAHLRGDDRARAWLRETRANGPLLTSVVTIAELTGGMRSTERHEVRGLIGILNPVPVTELIAHRAGDFARTFRRSHSGIGLADYLIAATAEAMSADLATLNVKHFPMLPELKRPFG